MCGRFSLVELNHIQKTFQVVPRQEEILPRYNIAPSQTILAVRNNEENYRETAFLRWGFVPCWQKKESIGTRWINARAETASQKLLFRYAFRHHRCLIVASSFFEWRDKKPYLIYCDDLPLFGMAGLWEVWQDKETGQRIESAVILTRDAYPPLDFLHHRMPVVIHPNHFASWLDRTNENTTALEKTMQSSSNLAWSFYSVNPQVNHARYDKPDCVLPYQE